MSRPGPAEDTEMARPVGSTLPDTTPISILPRIVGQPHVATYRFFNPRRVGTRSNVDVYDSQPNVATYRFFNPRRVGTRSNEDVYDRDRQNARRAEWFIDNRYDMERMPYLEHVRKLSLSWQPLSILVDFMEIGMSPQRWNSILMNQTDNERISRTRVSCLDYDNANNISLSAFDNARDFRDALRVEPAALVSFRLFVVEDLSREVIELLGATFDIEPHFFREHILDYAWYNTRDRWAYPPRFKRLVRDQRWFQIRYNTLRYFQSHDSFKRGRSQAECFNILRRLDDDSNNRAVWDQKDAVVATTRARTSYWLSDDVAGKARVGVLLVDPTVREGHPLWYGYGNWERTPSMHNTASLQSPPRTTLYEDIIYWAQRPSSLGIYALSRKNMAQIPALAMLHLVASEWLTMTEYIKTRLGQIEWEASYPEHFVKEENSIDIPLRKLHAWRRLVPLYREMLAETVHGAFEWHNLAINTKASTSGLEDITAISMDGTQIVKAFQHMREEFIRLESYMENFDNRIIALTSFLTSRMSIMDSRQALASSRIAGRLVWLAIFFLPLTFLTGLFSMQEDVSSLNKTYKTYGITAVPVTMTVVFLAVSFNSQRLRTWLRLILSIFKKED